MTVRVTNAGPDPATLHVLPTAWFRNTWSWDLDAPKPELHLGAGGGIDIDHPFLGPLELLADAAPDGTAADAAVLREPDQRGGPVRRRQDEPFPKDGINDHVVSGLATVNPDGVGTKASVWYQVDVAAGATAELRLRLRPADPASGDAAPFGAPFRRGRGSPAAGGRRLLRRDGACGVDRRRGPRHAPGVLGDALQAEQGSTTTTWPAGLPATRPSPPRPPRAYKGRNTRWGHFESFDIMSMPDKWEYPWFATWDLGFHCVALAHVDPAFAKYQLLLVCREWFQHPSGALPTYEWDFGDVNPTVQAWAALKVFAIDGGRDLDFLSKVFDKLLVNFTWWVNQEDVEGTNLFEGGFLGLDNIGPLDRSHLPVGGTLQQSDASGWMAFYALAMGSIASILNRAGRRPATDLVLKFLEHSRRSAPPSGPAACGTRTTASSTTSCCCPTARRSRSGSARWSASSRCSPRWWCTRDVLQPGAVGRQALRAAARGERQGPTSRRSRPDAAAPRGTRASAT